MEYWKAFEGVFRQRLIFLVILRKLFNGQYAEKFATKIVKVFYGKSKVFSSYVKTRLTSNLELFQKLVS